LVILLGVTPLLSACDAGRGAKAEVICCAQLRQIDASKQIWMIQQHKSTSDTPSWDDLRPYFGPQAPPKCPLGGTYRIGRVAEMATCSVSEHTAAYRAKKL
jgi:hypothetical protein